MAREPEREDDTQLGYYRQLASDPLTDPDTLRDIAAEEPSLRPAVAANPATYPGLLAWLAQLGDPEVDAALARRAAPAPDATSPGAPPAAPTPPDEADAVSAVPPPPPLAPPPPPTPAPLLPPPPSPIPLAPPAPTGPGTRRDTGRRGSRPSHRRGLVVGGVVAVAAVAVGLGAAAVVLARPRPDVWIASAADGLLGRVELGDGGVTATVDVAASTFEVISQDDAAVVVYDTEGSRLVVVDATTLEEVGPPVPVPVGSRVEVGGGVAAVLDSGAREVWVTDVDALPELDVASAEPALTDLSATSRLAVGVDGATYVVDPGQATLFILDVDGAPAAAVPLQGVTESDDLLVTAVGAAPVVLDRTNGRLHLPGSVVELATSPDSRVQRPGAAADWVLVATSTALVQQPLDGGPATVVRGGGESPPAPVYVGACGYAAWHATGTVVRDCPGDDDDLLGSVDVEADAELRFRFDGDAVVLNDQRSGGAWRAADDLEPIDPWQGGAP